MGYNNTNRFVCLAFARSPKKTQGGYALLQTLWHICLVKITEPNGLMAAWVTSPRGAITIHWRGGWPKLSQTIVSSPKNAAVLVIKMRICESNLFIPSQSFTSYLACKVNFGTPIHGPKSMNLLMVKTPIHVNPWLANCAWLRIGGSPMFRLTNWDDTDKNYGSTRSPDLAVKTLASRY